MKAIAALLATGFVTGIAAPGSVQAPVPHDAAQAFLQRRAELREAAASRSGEWDGDYRYGNGAVWRELVYVEGEGYADQSGGCVGGYSSFGVAERREDRLWLRSSQPPKRHMAEDLSAAPLVPVSWGEHRFLIEQDRIGDFILSVYEHDFSQCALKSDLAYNFLLRTGDENKPVSGLPQLPAAWQGQWRHEPVRLRVTAMTVDEDVYSVETGTRKLRYSLTLDAGSNQGLVAGLRLIPSGRSWLYSELPVIASVQADTSVVNIGLGMGGSGAPLRAGYSEPLLGSHPTDSEVIGPVVGYEFSTGALPAAMVQADCNPATDGGGPK